MKKESERRGGQTAAQIAVLLLLPAAAFYLLEFYTHNPFEEVRAWAQVFNIVLFELAAWLLFFLTGRVRAALRIELAAAMLFGIANAYVVRFRTNPIVPWDILSVKTAASVASNYDFTPEPRMVIVSLIFLALIATLQPVKYRIGKEAFIKRLVSAGCAAILLVLFAGRLQEEGFQTKYRLYPFLFTPVHMTNVNGVMVTFVMNLAFLSVEKPSGYNEKAAWEALEHYRTEDAGENGEKELPNIIVVMNEAFSDLSILGTINADKDYMPFFHRLQSGAENTVTGMLNVSVCGGNTANTEFEFLTGNSMAFLPQGSIPYQQYITGELPALPKHLASLGYRTVAMHPYYAGGWERDMVYPWLGFSECYFISDFNRKKVVRDYISDDACVDKIIQIFEEKEEGEPLFLFNVTMQNHGGYSEEFDNFTPDVSVAEADNDSLDRYLSLIKLSDAALERLIHYFEEAQEDTIVVFFGDHQPGDAVAAPVLSLNGSSVKGLADEELKLRYQTPYAVWANFDIPEQTLADTGANYLAAEVLRLAGIQTTPYQNFLLELKQEYPIVSAVRVKKSDGTETNAADEKEGLLLYRQLQYYQLFH